MLSVEPFSTILSISADSGNRRISWKQLLKNHAQTYQMPSRALSAALPHFGFFGEGELFTDLAAGCLHSHAFTIAGTKFAFLRMGLFA
jgi:hypothetical protein